VRDFFISYTSRDKEWAEWIARQLEEAGYTTFFQAWDFRPGNNFVVDMQKGLTECARIVLVLSPHFFESDYTQAEWTSAFVKDPTGDLGILVPVRVAECKPPGLLGPLNYIDLVGIEPERARERLLAGVKGGRAKPISTPPFPTSGRTPPTIPTVFPNTLRNIPFPQNPFFKGRDPQLQALAEKLAPPTQTGKTRAIVVHGLAGIGKTQLAAEFAWRHLGDYEAVFWLRADTVEALEASLAAIGPLLGLGNVCEEATLRRSVLEWIRSHDRVLLIADNVDTETARSAVTELLLRSVTAAVLITSTRRDWPITVKDLPLDILTPEDAELFLLERMTKRGHDAGNRTSAQRLVSGLGNLPLALEQAAAVICEFKWSFDTYSDRLRDTRRELLSQIREGATEYQSSITETWAIALNQLSPLARALLRILAWFAPDEIPREMLFADKDALAQTLGGTVNLSDFAIDSALGELDRRSQITLTGRTVSVHRLVQAVEQDSLEEQECKRWLGAAARLLVAFAPGLPQYIHTWEQWSLLAVHAEELLKHEEQHPLDDLSCHLLANQTGLFFRGKGSYEKAEILFLRSQSLLKSVKGPGAVNPNVLNNLGTLYRAQGRSIEAVSLLEQVVALRESALGALHPDVALGLDNLGLAYNDLGEVAKAKACFERAREIVRQALPPEDPAIARNLINLGGLLLDQGLLDDAQPLLESALSIRQKSLGSQDPLFASSLISVARVHLLRRQYSEAKLMCEQALPILEKTLGLIHPHVAEALDNLAEVYMGLAQYNEALSLNKRALSIRQEHSLPLHRNLALSRNNLGRSYSHLGQHEQADAEYQRALSILYQRQIATGRQDPYFATVANNYGEALTVAGLTYPQIVAKLADVCGQIKRQVDAQASGKASSVS
jgi:tetratricopeptide (TPR) repeat protein